MQKFGYGLVLATALSLGCGSVLCRAQSAPAAAPAATLADGTPIHLALGRTVSSESDQAGEVVEFLVKKDVVVGDRVVLAEGSSVYGKVTSSTLDNRETGTGGALEFRLETVKLANGQDIPLRTVKQLPSDPNADIKPEKLTNLVNSPYAPFAHFNNGTTITVPKNSTLTLYVAADINVAAPNVQVKPAAADNADSLASRIVKADSGGKSLGDLAREQRERGRISSGMVVPQN